MNGKCTACPGGCTACDDTTGSCTACDEGLDLDSDNGLCLTCPLGKFYDGTTCQVCAEGCIECEALTGNCLQCEIGRTQSGTECVECTYIVGPVGKQIICLDERYSDERLVPPFADSLTEVDWRDWDVVSPVADQGTCGSCYAFSTIAAAESAYAIKTGNLYRGSEQHIVACSTRNLGCDGG